MAVYKQLLGLHDLGFVLKQPHPRCWALPLGREAGEGTRSKGCVPDRPHRTGWASLSRELILLECATSTLPSSGWQQQLGAAGGSGANIPVAEALGWENKMKVDGQPGAQGVEGPEVTEEEPQLEGDCILAKRDVGRSDRASSPDLTHKNLSLHSLPSNFSHLPAGNLCSGPPEKPCVTIVEPQAVRPPVAPWSKALPTIHSSLWLIDLYKTEKFPLDQLNPEISRVISV